MTENVYIWRQNGFEHMAKFERWKHAWAHTGPFRVYKQYYLELNQYYWAAYSGHKITYTEMAKKGYTWEKTKRLDRQVIDDAIEGIAKGTWAQRRSAFDSLFGGHPVEWDTYEEDLEELRQKRNSVGHAFGRDINKARQFEEITPLPLEGIRQEKLIHYFDVTLKVASAIDQYLLDNHIEEYQALFSFHVFYTHHQDEDWDDEEMSKSFRKFLLMDKRRYGKQFFIDLVKYYKIA